MVTGENKTNMLQCNGYCLPIWGLVDYLEWLLSRMLSDVSSENAGRCECFVTVDTLVRPFSTVNLQNRTELCYYEPTEQNRTELCYSKHTCTVFLHCEPTEQNKTLLL